MKPLAAPAALIWTAGVSAAWAQAAPVKAGGVEFNASGKLGSALSYSLSGDIFYAQIDAGSLGSGALASTKA